MRPPSDDPQRRCILTGEHGGRASLIRLALGPDGRVAPDLQARAGGRGAWIAVPRAELEAAQKKGRLKGALLRAFKAADIELPDSLGADIEAGLARATFDRLGLENRAGALILGSERIAEALARGPDGQAPRAQLLIHAADAGADGSAELDRRASSVAVPVISAPAGREALSQALGRANVVHIAVAGSQPASRLMLAFERWQDFIGRNTGGRVGSHAGAPASPEPASQGRL